MRHYSVALDAKSSDFIRGFSHSLKVRAVTTDDVQRLGASSGSTPSASRLPRPTPGPSATSASAARAGSSAAAVHDGAARGLVPSRAAARRRAQRRLRGALLLRARAGAAGGARPAAALHLARPLRRPAREARRARPCPRRQYRVLVDANQHVDREAAVRSGVGFYGKNTMVLTRRHGSWVVLGTLVTTAELEPTPPLARRLRLVHALHRRLPDRARSTSRACSTRRAASRTGRRCRSRSPRLPRRARRAGRTAATSARTSARGTAGSSGGAQRLRARRGGARRPARVARGRLRTSWSSELDRLYVPQNDARWLRRNALVALGNVGEDEPRTPRRAGAATPAATTSCSPSTRSWALDRLEEQRHG